MKVMKLITMNYCYNFLIFTPHSRIMTDTREYAILITGAAGGLGRALVRMALTLPGIDRVVATDIREEVTTLFSAEKRVTGLVMDAASEASVVGVRECLRRESVVVRFLINNAGIFMFHPVSEITETLLDRIMRVNAYAPVLTVSVFLDDLIAAGGRVVQISTCGVRFPTLFQSYPASKIAMEALVLAVAAPWAIPALP